jgi:hypothetical protein
LTGVVLALAACGGETRDDPDPTNVTTAPNTTQGTTGDGGESSSSGPPVLDLAIADMPTHECAGTNVDAEAKLRGADVVIVVDNSSSMFFETTEVQNRLNAFAQGITEDGIDVRVVLLTAAAQGYYAGVWVPSPICIPMPLGSGLCSAAPHPGEIAKDSQDPMFLHVDQHVNSFNSLPVIIEQQPMWGPFTDSKNALHIVVVSDDDSQKSAGYFLDQFQMVEPDRVAIVHAIVPSEMCEDAANIGQQYIDLANLTGGVVGNLCDQDFASVFQVLINAVQQESILPCTFEVPTPPEGEAFAPKQVNVEFDDGHGGGFPVGHVETEADCQLVSDGWYYDDPMDPTSIVLCDQTCDAIQGFEGSQVQVVLGCATIPAG